VAATDGARYNPLYNNNEVIKYLDGGICNTYNNFKKTIWSFNTFAHSADISE